MNREVRRLAGSASVLGIAGCVGSPTCKGGGDDGGVGARCGAFRGGGSVNSDGEVRRVWKVRSRERAQK